MIQDIISLFFDSFVFYTSLPFIFFFIIGAIFLLWLIFKSFDKLFVLAYLIIEFIFLRLSIFLALALALAALLNDLDFKKIPAEFFINFSIAVFLLLVLILVNYLRLTIIFSSVAFKESGNHKMNFFDKFSFSYLFFFIFSYTFFPFMELVISKFDNYLNWWSILIVSVFIVCWERKIKKSDFFKKVSEVIGKIKTF